MCVSVWLQDNYISIIVTRFFFIETRLCFCMLVRLLHLYHCNTLLFIETRVCFCMIVKLLHLYHCNTLLFHCNTYVFLYDCNIPHRFSFFLMIVTLTLLCFFRIVTIPVLLYDFSLPTLLWFWQPLDNMYVLMQIININRDINWF